MITEFKIEKGIPIPTSSKYPFQEMQVGDSFVIQESQYGEMQKALTRINRRNQTNIKIKTKSVEGGRRVWRVY